MSFGNAKGKTLSQFLSRRLARYPTKIFIEGGVGQNVWQMSIMGFLEACTIEAKTRLREPIVSERSFCFVKNETDHKYLFRICIQDVHTDQS